MGYFVVATIAWVLMHAGRALGESCLPLTPITALRHATSMFPNIKVLLTILCTLPVISCSSEHSFSGLKRIKSSLRTTMGNSYIRLSGLAYC